MNTVALIIVTLFTAVFGTLGIFAWFGSRKRLREAKNYERGLKMVPLLINLPPQSSDTETGSRDARDVNEEVISQAQVLYDIIASTAKKGFKSKFYGQRHLTLEIVATHGRVNFYCAVPVILTAVVEQAIVSAYPTASLVEVEEHNIFSPVGKLSGTIGGELTLKKDFIQPIATFQDSKRDGMTALLNSLSELGSDDGAGLQILIRPAREGWSKKSLKVAKDKKEGKESGNFLATIVNSFSMLWSPPEESPKEIKQLTNLEQAEIDAIENKTKYAGYETLVRVIASSNTLQKSQRLVNNMVATFALFDAPGRNGFKYSEAKDIDSFVTAYIMRFFPPEINTNILNSIELATIFHFPDQANTPTSQLERQTTKEVDGPRNVPNEGLLFGHNVFRGVKKEIRLSDNDRRRHLYIVGQTGTGKSTVLVNLGIQDMINGKGFAFVDPHGDSVEELMGMVPKERIDDIIYFNPSDMDYPMGLNMFEFESNDQKDFLIQEAIGMLYKLYDPQHQGIIGPRYEHWFRNAALTLMADPAGSTFIDIPKVFTDDAYAKQKLKYVKDQTVLEFWNKEMAQTSEYHKSEMLGWFVSKFGAFLSNEMMRNIIGQTESSFNLRQVMDEGKILLVNLSKGQTGELNSKLLGMIFVIKFQSAAMSRANIEEDQRRDFSLYVDEFQNFSTDSFSSILSEARKYRLNLIVANQFISQLTDDIRDAVFGNVGSIISYRTGANDAEFLAKQFSPTFDVDDLVQIPNFHAISRIMINNVPSQPFSMEMLPPLGHENKKLKMALKKMSQLKHGKPKSIVEQAIFKRLETIAPAKPKFGMSPGGKGLPGGARPPQTGSQAPAKAGQQAGAKPSFLDDWLAKRKERTNQTSVTKPGRKPLVPTNKDSIKSVSNIGQTEAKKPELKSVSTPPKQQVNKDGTRVMETNKVHSIDRSTKKIKPATKNLSSTLEKSDNQAHKIAKALKEKSSSKKVHPTVEALPMKKEGLEEGDDLYIDKDGNLHYREED